MNAVYHPIAPIHQYLRKSGLSARAAHILARLVDPRDIHWCITSGMLVLPRARDCGIKTHLEILEWAGVLPENDPSYTRYYSYSQRVGDIPLRRHHAIKRRPGNLLDQRKPEGSPLTVETAPVAAASQPLAYTAPSAAAPLV